MSDDDFYKRARSHKRIVRDQRIVDVAHLNARASIASNQIIRNDEIRYVRVVVENPMQSALKLLQWVDAFDRLVPKDEDVADEVGSRRPEYGRCNLLQRYVLIAFASFDKVVDVISAEGIVAKIKNCAGGEVVNLVVLDQRLASERFDARAIMLVRTIDLRVDYRDAT
jgi:hypothetical protein